MHKIIISFIYFVTATIANNVAKAQNVGIGTNIPNASAILDIQSTTKGILLPRHSLVQMVNINNPANSLLLFNTFNNRLYYNSGTRAEPVWKRMETDADFSADNMWLLNGNTGTNSAIDFIGTVDATDLLFKVNNKDVAKFKAINHSIYFGEFAGRFNSTGEGNVGIGKLALINSMTTGHQVAIGENALYSYNGNNGQNIAIGQDALYDCNTCSQSVAIGNKALSKSIGSEGNVAVGHFALANATNNRNTAVGTGALGGLKLGNNNVAVGDNAGKINGSGTFNSYNNTFFGAETKVVNDLQNCTLIGYLAEAINDHTIAFGNNDVTSWVFGLTKPSAANRVLEVGSTFANGNGAYLDISGFWVNVSDVNKKQNIKPIDGKRLLQNLAALPVTQWRYKGSPDWHIGPMAQDFKALFNLGDDDKAITTVDASGVALAAIQQLMQENEWLEERVKALENRKK
jgi:hypothetical protein